MNRWDIFDSGATIMGLSALYEIEDFMWKSSTCDLALITAVVALVLIGVGVWRS